MSSEPAVNGHITFNILLIEDSMADVQLLKEAFKVIKLPHVLTHAPSLAAGLSCLGQQSFDLVLLDFHLPDSQGIQTLVKVRTHAPRAPIVILTASDDDQLAIQALERGAQDYLVKGFIQVYPGLLDRTVRYSIERQRMVTQIESTIRELQDSELNFHHVIESHFDGMVVVDRQHVVQFVNPAAEVLLDRSVKELVGKPFTGPVIPDKMAEHNVVTGGKMVRTVELRAVQTKWEGQAAFLISLRDISERKRVEQLKDEFVSKVSHELRTPLTSIKGTVTLMLNKALGEINDEQQDFLQTVGQDIDRLAELINNMLDLSKIEAGKMVMARQPLELSTVVDQVCRSYHTILGKRQVVKQFGVTPPVYADRNLIVQVISNLVGNAVKFTADDGTITFTTVLRGDQVALTVGDNGPGIPKESLCKLFQKFVQADGPGENRPKGTGLGLAISREIVELHQGEISVDSEVGKGTDFTFMLPVYDPAREFDKLFETMKGAANVISLLLIDMTELKAISSEFQKVVTSLVANRDHVLMVEPTLLAVLAETDSQGGEVMRQRLTERCTAWLKDNRGALNPRLQIVVSTYPAEGELAAVLMRQAKAKLRTAASGDTGMASVEEGRK